MSALLFTWFVVPCMARLSISVESGRALVNDGIVDDDPNAITLQVSSRGAKEIAHAWPDCRRNLGSRNVILSGCGGGGRAGRLYDADPLLR